MRLCPCVIVMGRPEPMGLKASLGDCPPTLWTEKGRKLLHAVQAFQRNVLGLMSQAHPQTPRHGSPEKQPDRDAVEADSRKRKCRCRRLAAERGADTCKENGARGPRKHPAWSAPRYFTVPRCPQIYLTCPHRLRSSPNISPRPLPALRRSEPHWEKGRESELRGGRRCLPSPPACPPPPPSRNPRLSPG